MRNRVILALIIGVLLLVPASPALAVHKGAVYQEFPGPDGSGGVHLTAKLVVDDYDFEDKIKPLILFFNTGNQAVEIHVSYLKLVKGTTDVRNTGPFTYTQPVGDSHGFYASPLSNPSGTYHSRIRMWVCWPGQPGDPCGNVVTWNSGNATYP